MKKKITRDKIPGWNLSQKKNRKNNKKTQGQNEHVKIFTDSFE